MYRLRLLTSAGPSSRYVARTPRLRLSVCGYGVYRLSRLSVQHAKRSVLSWYTITNTHSKRTQPDLAVSYLMPALGKMEQLINMGAQGVHLRA